MKFYRAFIFLCFAMMTCGCEDQDTVTPTPPFEYPDYFNCDFDLEKFDLLPSSLTYSPYNGKSGVFFADSLGTKIKFDVTEQEPLYITSAMIKYDVFSAGDTVNYCYRGEHKTFGLKSNSMSFYFSIRITANPYYQQPGPGIQYDYCEIWYAESILQNAQVFRALIDQRTAPEFPHENLNLSTYTIFGRTFNDVERTNFQNPPFRVYFNRTEGIVSFTDGSGKTWRFDRFE